MSSNEVYIRKIVIIVSLIAAALILVCSSSPALAQGSGKHLVEEITNSPGYSSQITYSYNMSGQLSQKMVYNNGSVESTTEYHYYPDGRLFEELYKGIINLYQHYDSKGTLIERDDTGGIGSPAYWSPRNGDRILTEYDANGHITYFENRSGDRNDPYILRYEYDDQGRILRFYAGDYRTDSYDYRPDGSYIRTRIDDNIKLFITEYYNSDGLRTQKDSRMGDDQSTVYYEYDFWGNLVRETNSRYDSERSWIYDEYGNTIEEWSNGRLLCTYSNSYDIEGNITESVRKAGDTILTTAYYYE